MVVDLFKAPCRRSGVARLFALKLLASGAAVSASPIILADDTAAKTPGRTYCFYRTCHRVKSLSETQALVGRDLTVVASHYDSCAKDRFNPCGLTSSGEPFLPGRADNAASPILPDGTIVLVWSKTSNEAIVVRINNAGPYWKNRKLDLSRAAARKLGIGGVGEVTMRVLRAPTPQEARYSRNRRYQPVPGPIGAFASVDAAHAAMSIMVAQGHPGSVALAGLAAPSGRADPSGLIATAYSAPVVAGFSIPKGALAADLIAQTQIEQRVVMAAAPPTVDVLPVETSAARLEPVAPKLNTATVATPRRTRVRAVEVRPVATDPLSAIAMAVTGLFVPPRTAEPKRGTKPAARKIGKPKAASKTVVASKPAPSQRVRVAAFKSNEFRAGHTTYAEDRYRKPKAGASASQAKKVASAPKVTPQAGTASAAPAKQAGIQRGKKSAALRKSGGWQSSAVFEVPAALPVLTGPKRWVPADGLRENNERPRAPLRRVHPSALV